MNENANNDPKYTKVDLKKLILSHKLGLNKIGRVVRSSKDTPSVKNVRFGEK